MCTEPKIYEYSNGAVVFLLPERVNWIKTSTTGKWIFGLIKNGGYNIDSLIKATCDFYQLPIEEIKNPVKSLVKEFVSSGIIKYEQNENNNGREPILLEDLSLQQLWLNLTSYCNYKCKHCYQLNGNDERHHISEVLAKNIIDQAVEFKVQQLVFSGGEPTLHPNFFDIVTYARKNFKHSIKLITNGSLQNDKDIEKLVKIFDDIQISVDGINEETHDSIRVKGSFKSITNLFHKINKIDSQKSVGISFTPLPGNIHQVPELYNLAIYLKAKYIHLNRPKKPASENIIDKQNTERFFSNEFYKESLEKYYQLLKNIFQDMELNIGLNKIAANIIDNSFDPASELLKPIKKQRCAAGILTIAINEKGDCFPCSALSVARSYGNLKKDSLKNIYTDMRKEMINSFSVDRDEECLSCDFRYFCGGGCRATGDDITNKDLFCDTLKERYRTFLKDLSKPVSRSEKNENIKIVNQDQHIFQTNC